MGVILACWAQVTFRTNASANPAGAGKQSVLRLAMLDTTSPIVDPAQVADEQNVQLASLLYSGLVRLDSSYHVVNDAAARIDISKDRRTYTFTLRHNLRFSNGDPVRAKDFRYAIQRSLNPAVNSPTAPTYLLDIQGAYEYVSRKAKSVSGIQVLGDYTLRITTRWPAPYFLMELTYPTSYALDSYRLTKLGAIDSTAWYTSPIGSGPYKLKTWSQNKLELVRNKYYAGPRPSIAQITISLSPLPDTGVYDYLTKTLDVVSLQDYDHTLVGLPGIRESRKLAIDGIYMNMRKKPFGNRSVRRALTLALNRPALVGAALGHSATPFKGYVPMDEPGYNPNLKTLSHNPRQAVAELKAGGFANPKRFPPTTLYYTDDPAFAKLAKAIVGAWHKTLHITVATQPLTLNTLVANLQANKLALYLFGWSADYPDPHDWLSLQWETGALDNNVHYHNQAFDRLVQTADVTWNQGNRARLYNRAQQLLADDAAWIPLYIPHRLDYMRPTVMNLAVTGYGLIPRSGNWAQVQVRKATSRHVSGVISAE